MTKTTAYLCPGKFIYLDEHIPKSVFGELLLLFLQRVQMLSQWNSLDQLHHNVQLVT